MPMANHSGITPVSSEWKVGKLLSAAGGVHGIHQGQAVGAEVDAIRILVALALDEYAKLATARFHSLIEVAFGQFHDRFALGLVFAFRNVIYQLFHNAETFQNLLHTVPVAGVGVTFRADDFLEVHLVVEGVGVALAHVIVPAAGTAARTGHAQ